MQKFLLLLVLPLWLLGDDGFISEYEYGQMLYNNPRGISCISCHGEFGEGKEIVKYRDKKEEVTLTGADIRNLNIKQFHKALNSNHTIMPRYYLVNKEIIAIYKYIKEKNRRLTQPKVSVEEEEIFIYNGDTVEEESPLESL